MECSQSIANLISRMNLVKLTILNRKSANTTDILSVINGVINNVSNGSFINLKTIEMNYSPLPTTNYKNLLNCKKLSTMEFYYSALDPIVNIYSIVKLTKTSTYLHCIFREYLRPPSISPTNADLNFMSEQFRHKIQTKILLLCAKNIEIIPIYHEQFLDMKNIMIRT